MAYAELANPPSGTTAIPADQLDHRTDEKIAAWLQERHDVAVSEKNVWAFWHSGFKSMPPWSQRNVINWVRRLGPDWTVHMLDIVPNSATNVCHFIGDMESMLPQAFNEGTMDGPTVGQHQADLVRLPLLYQHGGIWMDVGMLLFRHVKDICWNAIMDPESPFEVGGFAMQLRPGVESMMNSFIAARKGNSFIKRWHDIFLAVWGRQTNAYASNFHKHPLLRPIPLPKLTAEQLNAPEATVSMEFLGNYLTQVQCFERLRKIIDPNTGFNGPEYYGTHVFLLPSMSEMYYMQRVSSWQGPEEFALLSARLCNSDGLQDEVQIINGMLAGTATMKLSHAPPGEVPFLADIWSMPENQDADIAKGTVAAYMRYGSVRFNQIRDLEPIQVSVDTNGALRTGLLEPAATEGTTH
ncbi:glycosyltransferase [Purpureocillium lavendulum]|uniref:Glycosyltransferase n=1 Tax=Purpureocillium lavendulum TaxID=1247861 RepID=A0AB34FBG3_9HYPO|nr:glycosyltransferase [Purpureocillium lavendulum]